MKYAVDFISSSCIVMILVSVVVNAKQDTKRHRNPSRSHLTRLGPPEWVASDPRNPMARFWLRAAIAKYHSTVPNSDFIRDGEIQSVDIQKLPEEENVRIMFKGLPPHISDWNYANLCQTDFKIKKRTIHRHGVRRLEVSVLQCIDTF